MPSPPIAPGDKLWWADQVSEKMGTCNKADGSGSVVLRNSTTLVMHMKVYDESIQLGETGLEGQGSRWGSERSRPQEPLGKGANGNENGVGSAHHPKGFPFLSLTEAPYRLTGTWLLGQGPGGRMT